MSKKSRLRNVWFFKRLGEFLVKLFHIKIVEKIPKRFMGKEVIDHAKCMNVIREAIEQGKPFLVGRYGMTEARAMFFTDAHYLGVNTKDHYEEFKNNISNLSGMFSNDDAGLKRFVDMYENAGRDVDVFGIWNKYWEKYLFKYYVNKNALYTYTETVFPYDGIDDTVPWTAALKGKRVVVVSSFADTIDKQYRTNREKIWPREDLLPEFELRTVKAVQTLVGNRDERFETWFDALEYQYNECFKEDFDVAVIGCGAYGYPLGAMIKERGKIAIVVGGDIQLWFGIKGKRWDNTRLGAFYNDAWVRPDDSEKIKNADGVENACYW